MKDDPDSIDEPSADEIAALGAMLARADIWDDPPAGLEDAVVAAIADEVAIEPPNGVTSLDERRSGSMAPWWLAAAAVAVVVVAGVTLFTRDGGSNGGVVVALVGTEAAPAASAEVTLTATPAGLKIELEPDGLPPAPAGSYYEAWISDGTKRVSAGGFHLRGGKGPIELWAGVAEPEFRYLSITLEPVDGDTDTSGDIRLRGEYDLGND